jgi:hypothetical protein
MTQQHSGTTPSTSLKAQALAELQQIPIDPEGRITYSALETIRCALEEAPISQ